MIRHYKKRISLLIELLGGKCVVCGSKEGLEFDHIDPKTKKFTITEKWSYSIQKVLLEVSKCQLLCHICHKEKNKIDNGESKHGMYSMYRHHKCRCRLCMNAYNEVRKKWRLTARKKGKKW
jgi:5-methylcytosine-specific restriction endonuclease McrA